MILIIEENNKFISKIIILDDKIIKIVEYIEVRMNIIYNQLMIINFNKED